MNLLIDSILSVNQQVNKSLDCVTVALSGKKVPVHQESTDYTVEIVKNDYTHDGAPRTLLIMERKPESNVDDSDPEHPVIEDIPF